MHTSLRRSTLVNRIAGLASVGLLALLAVPASPGAPALNPALTPASDAVTPSAGAEAAAVEGGDLVVDAKVPVEILVEGMKLGQLYFPGEVRYRIVAGHHLVRLYTNGQPTDLPIDLAAGQRTRVLVGRTGITVSNEAIPAAPAGPARIELRFVGTGQALVRLGSTPHALQPGHDLTLELPSGAYPLSVRSADGTVIWASGQLDVSAGDAVVVQVGEGRMPEVSGPGAFHAGGS